MYHEAVVFFARTGLVEDFFVSVAVRLEVVVVRRVVGFTAVVFLVAVVVRRVVVDLAAAVFLAVVARRVVLGLAATSS